MKEPYYLTFLQQINTKYSEKQMQIIKDKLSNNDVISINPFVSIPYHTLREQSLAKSIILMAKQMDQLPYRQLNQTFLKEFISHYSSDLKDLLSQSTFHSTMFCLTIIRYIQQTHKNYPNYSVVAAQLEELLALLQNLLGKTLSERKIFLSRQSSIKRQQSENQIHNIFLVLMMIASIRCMGADEFLINEQGFIQNSLKLAIEFIKLAQNQREFKVLMEYLSVVSYLIIFNEEVYQPTNFVSFTLDQKTALHQNVNYLKKQINENYITQYFSGLQGLIREEKRYKSELISKLKKLIQLNIMNEMIVKHIGILIDLIKEKTFPSLKTQFVVMLVEAQNSKNTYIVDQITQLLLNIGADFFDEEVQKFTLILLRNNPTKRIQIFVRLYNTFLKDLGVKVSVQTINFILSNKLKYSSAFENIRPIIRDHASIIDNKNMETLHQLIRSTSQKIYIQMLEDIVQNRSQCFQSGDQCPFVLQIWLKKVGPILQVYHIFFDALIKNLCGINKLSTQTEWEILTIAQSQLPTCSLYYEMLLTNLQKEEIYSQHLYVKVAFCQAILGYKLKIETYSYYSKYIAIQNYPSFIIFLRNLVTKVRTSSAVILYVHALLYSQINYDLNFILHQIQHSQFFRIVTYSIQAVALLYEFILKAAYNNQNYQTPLMIIQHWSGQMKKAQCKLITYFYIYRQIRKIYPFLKESKMRQPTDRLKILWDIIVNILNEEQPNSAYIRMGQLNKLIVQSSNTKPMHRSIQIQAGLLSNIFLEESWNIEISTTLQQYNIFVSKSKITVIQRSKEIKSNIASNISAQWVFHMENGNCQDTIFLLQLRQGNRIHFMVNKTEIQQIQMQGYVQAVKFCTQSNLLLKKIKIKDNKELENLSTITDHLNHLNEWTIKLKKLNLTKVSSFVEKFDFDHAFCLFASMLKNDYISLSQSYNMCFRIAIKMVKLLYRQGKMEKPASIMCIFNKLQKYFYRLENDAKNLQTILDLQCPEKYGSLLYYLISSAILPKIFWDSFSNSTKLSLKRFLKKMFQENNFISYQNSQLNLFERCLQLSLTHRQFLDICGSIVMKHSLNNILTFKFKRYLCLVSFNPEFKPFCSQLLKRIISHLNNGNTKYIQEQMHSRFIIMNFQEIYNIFALCNIQGKITILQTLSFELVNSNNNNKQKIKEVIRQLTEIVQENEKNYLIPWLITQLNQEINISPKINFQKLKVVSHYLQLIFLNYSFCLKTEKINMMKIVLQSLKVIKQSVKNYAFEVQLRAIFNANAYAKGIQEFKKDGSQQSFKQIKSQIEQSILSLILSHFSKQLFLKFFIHLRRNINNNLNLLFYLIDHQSFAQLQPFKLSIYLQFLVQMMTIIQYRSPFKQQENQLISKQIIRSLSKILSNAESFHSKGLRKYLFYSYPRLECKPYYLSQQRAQLLYRLKLAQSIQYQQLKGGIYFKCVLIILKAMDIQPKSDYTHLVKYFLLHPQGFNKRKIKGQVFRSFIEGYKSSVIQLHKQYYHESDTEMKHQQDSSIDLDNYIVDYFLMGLSKFMSKNSKEISSNLLFKYNQLFLQGCLQPQIWKDIISSEIRYLAFDNYEILLKLLNGQYIYQPEYQSKKILNMFQLVKQDHRNWIVQPQCHNIHLHFSSKAKEIMIIEHIHTHYVLSQIGKKTYIQGMNNNDVWREEDFNKLYEILLQQERRVPTSNQLTYFEEKLRKIKKIQPYTCRRKPVYKVMQNCLNNLACPATFKFVAKNYEATRTKSQKSINFDHYLQSKIQVHSPFENGSITELIVQDYSQESDTVGQYCQLITKQGSYFCQYQLQDKILKLFSRIDKPQASEYWFLLLGSNNFIHIENRQFSIDLGKSDEIFIRKYNNITANSIQIFYPNGTSRFLNFFVKKNLSSFMLKIQKVTKGLKIIKDASLYFQELRYTEKWLKGYLSNFDYLMLINKFSGRTYNDLNQYYIFPWVLQNYDTHILDLNHTNNYRDLSKPIGALNQKQLQKCKKKYYEELELNVQACFYRSHYSTEAFVFYYLFRIQPYSSLYRDLQGQKWDDPDRLFASIRQVWESVTDQKGDIKQLIPQFYYFPLFLRNISNVDFGIRQNNQKVNHVILPKWCSSPQQFILTMRAALQSDYVSQNLHHWIDLIFGVHQKSAEKNNVFRANCYADPRVYSSIRKQTHQAIKGIVAQINYFGQCPIQLFKKQHKPKHTLHFKDKRSVKSQISSTIRPSREYISFQGKIKSLDNDQQYFYLQIEIRNQTKWFSLPISEPVQKIKQILQKPRFKNKDLSTIKVKVRDENQLTIGDEILFDISIKFQYSHIQTSQMWIACYGTKGIKVLSWQQEQYWSWLQDQVCQVYVQTTRLIFLTPTGKLYFYSFFDKTIQQYRVFKDVCNMTMRVHRLPRLPSKQKNFIQYRVLCVGDAKKVMTIQHKYSEVYNSTSRANLTR